MTSSCSRRCPRRPGSSVRPAASRRHAGSPGGAGLRLQGLRLLHHRLRQGREGCPEGRSRRGASTTAVKPRLGDRRPKAPSTPSPPRSLEGGSAEARRRVQEGGRVSDALRAGWSGWRARWGPTGVEFVLERPATPGTATSPPTSRWCWPGAEGATRARRRAGHRGAGAARGRSSPKTEIAGPGFINFWLASDALAALAARHHRGRAAATGGPRFGRGPSRSTSSSSRPTRPGRCTWGTAAARRWATGSPRCSSGPGTRHPRVLHQRRRGADRPAGAEPLGAACSRRSGAERDSRGRLSRRVPAGDRGASARARAAGFADLPDGPRASRRCRALALPDPARGAGPRLLADFGVRFDVMTSEQALYDDGEVAARARAAARPRASPTRRTARSGSAPPTSATTRTGCSGRATAPTPTSCPTSPITSTSTSAASTAPSTSGAPITTATSRGCARCCRRWATADDFFDVALVQLVKVMRGGEEVKMSKRAGEFVTLRDLLDEVGRRRRALLLPDAAGRRPFTFDVDLATQADRREPGLLRADGARADERHLPGGGRRRRRASDGRRRLERAAGAGGRRAAEEAGRVSRGRRQRAARDREPHRDHRLPRGARPAWPTAGTTSAGCWASRPPIERGRGWCWRAPRASCSATASPCSASPPRIGCDVDEPARGRQRRARLDLHPVRRDRGRAGRLGGVLQRRGLAAPSGAGGRRGGRRLPGGTSWSGWRRAASTGAGWSGPTGESFRWKGKYSYDLQSRETLETRLGVFADFQPQLPAGVRRTPSSSSSATSIPSCSSSVLDQIADAAAGGLRHHELLDPEQARRRCSSCCSGWTS